MTDTAPLSLPTDSAPPDRYCDLVMKGGITSGVVYPLAIAELAAHYRFKNIGGTSAGAIAAALTAAAEYRRRQGSMDGFERLRRLPDHLGERVGEGSRLRSLFQPAPTTRRLFDVLLSALNRNSTQSRWLGILLGIAGAYAGPALAGMLAALVLWALASNALGSLGLLGAILSMAICALAGIGIGIHRDIVQGVVPNGFGLCSGSSSNDANPAQAGLVDWLHDLLQRTAGRTVNEDPLTFADLWQADGFPPPWLPPVDGRPGRSINLQMFTTNVTHGRPYHLPLEDETSRLFFKPEELTPYFPSAVVDFLVRNSRPYAAKSSSDPNPSATPAGLLELPFENLPIVVATRLSLSFPLLVSAVPLWAIDYEPRQPERTIGRCWFSDGGISSNFPIHLFDGLVPMWPTFGIELGRRGRHRPDEATWLPQKHFQGRGDGWNRFDDKATALGRLGGFLVGIVSAAQNWNDMTSMRMPGVRDRVVHVLLREGEGGLNLDMSPTLISALAGYGAEAGAKLRDKFASPPGTTDCTRGWNEHRWVRLMVASSALRERIAGIAACLRLDRHAEPIGALVALSKDAPPLDEPAAKVLTQEQVDALLRSIEALEQLEQAFSDNAVPQPYRAIPSPNLRVRPPL